jgi:hypothetical protein
MRNIVLYYYKKDRDCFKNIINCQMLEDKNWSWAHCNATRQEKMILTFIVYT